VPRARARHARPGEPLGSSTGDEARRQPPPRLMASTSASPGGGRVARRGRAEAQRERSSQSALDASLVRTTAWVGVGFAAVGVIGLIVAPGAAILWVVLLVFAIMAVPQAARIVKRERR
jgi:hypothetical protein